MKKRFKVIASNNARQIIYAAEEDDFMSDTFDEDPVTDLDEDAQEIDTLDETVDDLADTAEDLQDAIDETVDEDDPSIETDNNIERHFIAECDKCGGVFISAVIHSEATMEYVSGVCPLCGKESNQFLNWVILSTAEYDKLSKLARPSV